MATVPDEYRELLDGGVYGTIATVDPDGAPHMTPIWIDFDPGVGRFLINTVPGRRKERNLRRNPAVALTYIHPENPRRYIAIQGAAVEFRSDGAIEHFDELAENILGESNFYETRYDEDVSRVIVAIEADSVYTR
jgi:PPOX class probable F420-dependent enzyme